ncbi:uncharacterized protein LOC101894380 [Musca domestica]|uniref:Uncharacterized protein LOC101894380 n=1 Tax=Musca domestica TaxID=7370 RepID=A0A1I8MF39_MUSDO|nr:uncharacterized protein LOC101894380 [Musca domestica]
MSKKKLTSLSIREKLNIIKEVEEEKANKKYICDKYKCNISTVHRILKRKDEIRQAAANSLNLKQKRNRKGFHYNVEKALTAWYYEQQGTYRKIAGTVLIKKAKQLAIELGEDFEPDANWIFRWRRRNICGPNAVDEEEGDDSNFEIREMGDESSVHDQLVLKCEYENEDVNAKELIPKIFDKTDMLNGQRVNVSPEAITEESMEVESTNKTNSRDSFDRIVETWADKLRRMDPLQQLWAEKFINDIMLEGQLGNLHRHSVQIM